MSEPKAELSSIASALDDLTTRIAGLAENCQTQGSEELAHDLFNVERSLIAGKRRLDKIVSGR